jgi:hypothetical protein
MGAAEELKAMATRQELELIEPSAIKASELLTDARRSLATCRAIAASDPKSTLLLAWDGVAFPTLTAALALAGYRVTNRMGHHRAAIDAARQLLGADALISRIGSLRRMRDRGMYESELPEVEEVIEALDDCEGLIQLVGKAVQRAADLTQRRE